MNPSAGLIDTKQLGREANHQPWAHRSRRAEVFHTIVSWLRRQGAQWARAWALAAGVPPHLYS